MSDRPRFCKSPFGTCVYGKSTPVCPYSCASVSSAARSIVALYAAAVIEVFVPPKPFTGYLRQSALECRVLSNPQLGNCQSGSGEALMTSTSATQVQITSEAVLGRESWFIPSLCNIAMSSALLASSVDT